MAFFSATVPSIRHGSGSSLSFSPALNCQSDGGGVSAERALGFGLNDTLGPLGFSGLKGKVVFQVKSDLRGGVILPGGIMSVIEVIVFQDFPVLWSDVGATQWGFSFRGLLFRVDNFLGDGVPGDTYGFRMCLMLKPVFNVLAETGFEQRKDAVQKSQSPSLGVEEKDQSDWESLASIHTIHITK